MGERNDFNVVLGILTEYRGFQPAENNDLSVSKDVFIGSAGEYQEDERQVLRGSAGEYQADEPAGVAWLIWRVSGR